MARKTTPGKSQKKVSKVTKIKRIINRINNSITAVLNVNKEKISPEIPLYSLGADSLDVTELIVKNEKKFKIKLPEFDKDRFQQIAIRDVYRAVLAALGSKVNSNFFGQKKEMA